MPHKVCYDEAWEIFQQSQALEVNELRLKVNTHKQVKVYQPSADLEHLFSIAHDLDEWYQMVVAIPP